MFVFIKLLLSGSFCVFIGSSGFLPSSNAFLFTLNNPHQLPPTKFPIKQDHRQFAAHTNQFVGPSFGFNDLTVYEDLAGRLACWSNLGTSYNISNNTVGKTNVFTGSRLFYPDEVEVFFYDCKYSYRYLCFLNVVIPGLKSSLRHVLLGNLQEIYCM